MANKLDAFSFLVMLMAAALNASADENSISTYSQAGKGVVPIQMLESVCTTEAPQAEKTPLTLGTGFYVTLDEGKSLSTWLVTARHVVEKRVDLVAKANVGSGSKDVAYMVLPGQKWIFHPAQSAPGTLPIDVAVMKVLIPSDTRAFGYCPSNCSQTLSSKRKIENHLNEPPEPTSRALFFGYPLGEVIPGEIPPFARSGIVAYSRPSPQLVIDGLRPADDALFYVDAPSFPGNSGGPVITDTGLPHSSFELFGLVTGSSPTRSYTLVTSVTRIKETILYAAKQQPSAQQSWSRKAPSCS